MQVTSVNLLIGRNFVCGTIKRDPKTWGASSAEAAQQRRLILPDFDGRIWVHAVKLMLKVIENKFAHVFSAE